MVIEVRLDKVYGNNTIYPMCANAKRFADLAGTKTLTRSACRLIRALGITITVIPQKLDAVL